MAEEKDDSLLGSFAKLPVLTKVAAVLFIVAKVNGFAGAAAMFAHRPLSAFLLSVAGVALTATVALAVYQLGWGQRPQRLVDKLEWHRAEILRLEAQLEE